MEKIINGIVHIPAQEAAFELATTQLRVLMLLKRKDLDGTLVDGEWFVSRPSLECCKTHGKDVKVEQGCTSYCSSGGCGCK